jgi:hypothetical protein
MTTIFTKGTTSVVPLLLTDFASTRASGNVIHDIIGTSIPDVTFKPAGLRTGTLELLFADLTGARAAEAMFASVGVVIMSDTDLPDLNMTLVPAGNIALVLHDDRVHWLVTVDYQEVRVA